MRITALSAPARTNLSSDTVASENTMMSKLSLILYRFTGLLDRINDRFTSYRLVLYILISLIAWAAIGNLLGQVSFSWYQILISAGFITAICWAVNKALSVFMDIPANKESAFITALILALILTPPKSSREFIAVTAAAATAMAAKYIITFRKSHIFNPAAAGAFVAGEIFNKYPSWWVGNRFMVPLIVIGGLLIVRKTKRFAMVGAFLAVYLLYLLFSSPSGSEINSIWLGLVATPVIFFSVIMLTEPLTSPAQTRYYLPYAVLVGLLYSVTRLKLSPVEALLLGNIFTFVFAANRRIEPRFIRKIQEAKGIYSYVFSLPPKFSFAPGQYLEWTLAHNNTDSRGNRRYLTLSSSPTEPGLMFTIKLPDQRASSFKQRLDELKPGDKILASRVAGSFTLPKNQAEKLAFLAGGVGITPFRSMVKSMIDNNQRRDIALMYSVNNPEEISFKHLFEQAENAGLRITFVTDERIDEAKIKAYLPDYKERTFYISGPYGFVNTLQSSLLKLGVRRSDIITDYFPGYGA